MNDEYFMSRAIVLAENSFSRLDMPVGCVITLSGNIISESENYAYKNRNHTEHAEVLAMIQATKVLNTTDLSECTLYTTMEPCPMCSFLIREYRIKKVVFAIDSPDMGGYSKYPILGDPSLSDKYPHHFGNVPEIVTNFLNEKALEVWEKRSELKKNGEKYRLEKY